MRAMILSAGEGRRMLPLTLTTPKPLIKVNNLSLIERTLINLSNSGFKDIVINIAHLGYKIQKQLSDGEKYNLHIEYSDEQKEGGLESAGGIKKALPLLEDDTFLVVNGDIYCDYEFDKSFKLSKDILAHLILVPNPPHNIEGDFSIKDNIVIDKKEYTFSGIGYYSPKLFESLPYGKSPLAPLLREAIKQKRVTAEIYNGKWVDVGTPQRLSELERELNG